MRFCCNKTATLTFHRISVCVEGRRLELARRKVNIFGTQQKLEDMALLFLLAQNYVCVWVFFKEKTYNSL